MGWSDYSLHHKFLGGVAVYLLLASLATIAGASAAVPISTSTKDSQSNHRAAYRWKLALTCLTMAGGALAGIIGLKAWLSPTHTTTIAEYRAGPKRHMPWYVAGFGAMCGAVAMYGAALVPSAAEGQKALVDQNWSPVATTEAVLYMISLGGFALALLFVAIGGAHHMNGKRNAGKTLFVPMEQRADVVNIYHPSWNEMPPVASDPLKSTGVDQVYATPYEGYSAPVTPTWTATV